MDELSTEVKAKETHEKAVSYFKVSEQYGYKFIMEVKKIRDDRYYKELGFNTFEEYCNQAWGFNRAWVNQKIQSATNLTEEDFGYFSSQYGVKKTFLLATMEDEQREQAINEGVPTEQGNKSIDEATQKEINEYKKRAKQAEHQAEMEQKERERLESENEELANQEPDTIYPDDYDYYKGNYESAVALRDRYKEQLEEMREEIGNMNETSKNEDSEIERLQDREKTLKNKVNSFEKVFDLQSHLEIVISTVSPKMNSIRFDEIRNDYQVIDDFDSTLDEVINVCNKLKDKIPDKNIIEGDVIDD